MDSPWRVGAYNLSSVCEAVLFESIEPDVCPVSYPFLSRRPLYLNTDSGKYSTEVL